jgi:signal transduction histidine kinase
MNKSFFAIKDTIAARLLTRVFYFYIIVTISVTLVHMLADFKSTQLDTEADLIVFQGAFQPGLAIALWNQEDFGLRSSLLAMVKIPQIVGAQVFDESGKLVGAIGEVLDENGEYTLYQNNMEKVHQDVSVLNQLFWNKADIYFVDDSRYHVGYATLYSSQVFVFARVKDGYVFIIINSIIKTLALWIIVLTLSKPMVTKPLLKLSNALKQRSVDNLDKFTFQSKWSQSTEFIALEDAFNDLLSKLTLAIDNKNKVEAQILVLNKSLEEKVDIRTQDLQTSNDKLTSSLAEIKATHELLIESEKMAALGALVSGVAHEVNTPLGISVTLASNIQDKISLLLQHIEDGTLKRSILVKSSEYIKENAILLLSNANRASDLIANFKEMAVDQSFDDLRSIEVAQYLAQVIETLKPKFKRSQITVTLVPPTNKIMINSYPGALAQIITNLLMGTDQIMGIRVPVDIVPQQLSKAKLCLYFYRF